MKSDAEGSVIARLQEIAADYSPRGEESELTLQDFHSFRQALNVASGDQRLLVFAVGKPGMESALANKLKPVFADPEVIGRFHLDFADESTDQEWTDSVRNSSRMPGLYVIRSEQFGQEGEVVETLSLQADAEEIKGALLASNLAFSLAESRKDYATHVSQGRRNGIHFENGMPYGEDRDGDGEIDKRGASDKGPGGSRPR